MNPSPIATEAPLAVVQPWRHPLSRWYLLPAVLPAARLLVRWSVPPCGITLLGAALAAGGLAGVVFGWWGLAGAAGCFWGAWCCDRLDGAVARLARRCSPAGARLDACCDEAADLLAHLALATVAHRAGWPLAAWGLLAVFAGCKGVFLWWSHFSPKPRQSGGMPQKALSCGEPPASDGGDNQDTGASAQQELRPPGELPLRCKKKRNHHKRKGKATAEPHWLRCLYHLGGNADLRWHLVLAAMLLGWPLVALGYGAGYFALRVLVGGIKRWLRARVSSVFFSTLGGSLPVQATRGTTP